MREKLIELLQSAPADIMGNHGVGALADHLITNGATFATDNNVGCKWIPVTERLPEQEMEVIVYTGNILKPSVFSYHFWKPDMLSWQSVTHWMPLPEPPKEG